MKILLNFNNNLFRKKNRLGGIETLNYNFYERFKKKKNLIIEKKSNSSLYDVIISSNDARIFNQSKSHKKILWLHNKLQLEKAFRKKQLFSLLFNNIEAVFVSKYLKKNTSRL